MNDVIDTAVVLAAGMGNRLKPFTNYAPKCMVEVLGKPLMAHLIDSLEQNNFKKLVLVTGYKSDQIEQFIESYETTLDCEVIYNDVYNSTNNIYSLWLAKPRITSSFILIESDIILDPAILSEFKFADKIALDIFNPEIHDGTTATVDVNNSLEKLYIKQAPPNGKTIYKTVNIYSFSGRTWNLLVNEIEKYIEKDKVNGFYEVAIQNLVEQKRVSLEMVDFSGVWWDEIDTPKDLERVNHILSNKIAVE
ncbi:MAG: phosphocholine cytidylyltransferase family protein [Balneolaceae bacterium]|nr:MAG: phosphocholine cytidylyltransferase family protein [Balneolaceae bacterium]